MVCEAPFLLLYLIDLTLTYVFWFDLDLWVHAKLLKRVNEGCPLVFQIEFWEIIGLKIQICEHAIVKTFLEKKVQVVWVIFIES